MIWDRGRAVGEFTCGVVLLVGGLLLVGLGVEPNVFVWSAVFLTFGGVRLWRTRHAWRDVNGTLASMRTTVDRLDGRSGG